MRAPRDFAGHARRDRCHYRWLRRPLRRDIVAAIGGRYVELAAMTRDFISPDFTGGKIRRAALSSAIASPHYANTGHSLDIIAGSHFTRERAMSR